MFFIVIGVVVGVFIEQTYPLPKLREIMKCSKEYGESGPTEPVPEPEPHEPNDVDETTHTD